MERISNLTEKLNLDIVNETRFRILQLFYENRKIPLRLYRISDGLRSRFGVILGKSTICYHLDILIHNDFIRKKKGEAKDNKGFAKQNQVYYYILTVDGETAYESLKNIYVKVI